MKPFKTFVSENKSICVNTSDDKEKCLPRVGMPGFPPADDDEQEPPAEPMGEAMASPYSYKHFVKLHKKLGRTPTKSKVAASAQRHNKRSTGMKHIATNKPVAEQVEEAIDHAKLRDMAMQAARWEVSGSPEHKKLLDKAAEHERQMKDLKNVGHPSIKRTYEAPEDHAALVKHHTMRAKEFETQFNKNKNDMFAFDNLRTARSMVAHHQRKLEGKPGLFDESILSEVLGTTDHLRAEKNHTSLAQKHRAAGRLDKAAYHDSWAAHHKELGSFPTFDNKHAQKNESKLNEVSPWIAAADHKDSASRHPKGSRQHNFHMYHHHIAMAHHAKASGGDVEKHRVLAKKHGEAYNATSESVAESWMASDHKRAAAEHRKHAEKFKNSKEQLHGQHSNAHMEKHHLAMAKLHDERSEQHGGISEMTLHKVGDSVLSDTDRQGLKPNHVYKVTNIKHLGFGTVEYELDGKHNVVNGHILLKKLNNEATADKHYELSKFHHAAARAFYDKDHVAARDNPIPAKHIAASGLHQHAARLYNDAHSMSMAGMKVAAKFKKKEANELAVRAKALSDELKEHSVVESHLSAIERAATYARGSAAYYMAMATHHREMAAKGGSTAALNNREAERYMELATKAAAMGQY